MITGLPPYRAPVEIGVRCVCSRYYIVFTGVGQIIGNAEGRARERAANMSATFVDAREVPFMNCVCGQSLDFSLDESLIVM